ncbi:MAG: hypothetical protein FJZ90_01625, partial [Chloroflexi bacterium]|nr:hypothetical protein [Chloroflexota bacterium]
MKPWLQAITRRIRQNHALEHATMHLLARTQGPLRLVGRSDWRGFWLYGVVPTEAVRSAAHEALARLHAGEADMAVHARCGTNIVVAALLAGTGVALASAAVRAGSTPSGGFRRWA